jgi:hypothetical protein
MIIGRKPPVPFAIANNLLVPSFRAINLRISPQTTTTTWNNSENPKDGSFGMKHFERCSYTILESPPENKWGVEAKACANQILFKIKMCSGCKSKIGGEIRFEGGGCS